MLGTVLNIRNNIVGKSSKSAKLNEEFLGRESSGDSNSYWKEKGLGKLVTWEYTPYLKEATVAA